MRKSWRERIAEARERGGFTEEERLLAGTWNRCAVGERREEFVASGDWKRPELNAPGAGYGEADSISRLGVAFCGAVGGDNFDKAEKVLGKLDRKVESFLSYRYAAV